MTEDYGLMKLDRDFEPSSLLEQFHLLNRKRNELLPALSPPSLTEFDEQLITLADGPRVYCFQALFYHHLTPGSTNMVATEILYDREPLNLPSPWNWSSGFTAGHYGEGFYVLDIAFQPGECTVLDMRLNSERYGPVRLGGADAIMATGLQSSYEICKIPLTAGCRKIIFAGLNLHVGGGPSVRAPALVPFVEGDERGSREPLNMMWSHESSEGAIVPLIMRVQSFKDLKIKKEKIDKAKEGQQI